MFALEFCTWIPNNNASLDKNRIPSESCGFIQKSRRDDEIELELLPTYEYSDSITGLELQLPLSASFKMFFREQLWKFEMKIQYAGKVLGAVDVEGVIHSSGLLKFKIIDMTNIEYTRNLPNLIFTLIKRIVHEDNHHGTKIDTLIPVIERKNFKHELVLSHLADRIKDIEYQAKLLKKKKSSFKEFKELEAMLLRAKGIFTYYRSYSEIFVVTIQKTPQYVIDSLELILDELKSKMESVKYKYGTIVSLVALFISGNILFKTADKQPFQNFIGENFLEIETGFVLLLVFLFLTMHFKLKGNIIDRLPLVKELIVNAFIYSKITKVNIANMQHKNFITFFGLNLKKIVVLFVVFSFASLLALLFSKSAGVVFLTILLPVVVVYLDFRRWKRSEV